MFNNLPDRSTNNTFIFTATSASFQTWNKPEGVSMINFLVVGGGGGGGSGRCSGGLGVISGSGGGGGAAGGIVTVAIPAILIPDVLYISVGNGGTGGASQTTATNGQQGGGGDISYVCIAPELNSGSILIQSSQVAPGGGAGGAATGNSAAGTAITIVSNTTGMLWIGIAGQSVAQTAGGVGAAGSTSNLGGASIGYVG